MYGTGDYYSILGLGNKAKVAYKKELKAKYGKEWRKYYKDERAAAGGRKGLISKLEAEADILDNDSLSDEQKEIALNKLDADEAKKSNMMYWIIGGVATFIVLGVIGVVLYKQAHK